MIFQAFVPAPLERTSGNYWLIETLRRWGITTYAGVNGGGLIHVTKHLEPLSDLSEARDGAPRMLSMGEYVAGFVPLGYYLASGRGRGLHHHHRRRHQSSAAAA